MIIDCENSIYKTPPPFCSENKGNICENQMDNSFSSKNNYRISFNNLFSGLSPKKKKVKNSIQCLKANNFIIKKNGEIFEFLKGEKEEKEIKKKKNKKNNFSLEFFDKNLRKISNELKFKVNKNKEKCISNIYNNRTFIMQIGNKKQNLKFIRKFNSFFSEKNIK